MKDEVSADKKADILMSALAERYFATHQIRARVQGVCLWCLGLLVGASGWLIQSDAIFSLRIMVLIGSGVAAAYLVLRFRYFRDLEVGFKGQMSSAAKIEKALHLYTPGYFLEGEESVYPPQWVQAGTAAGKGKYFHKSYEVMAVGLLLFFAALALKTAV